MNIALERRYRFSASHLYRRAAWTEEKNRRHFGRCANLPGHGHNYRLFVRIEGPIDPETGFLVDLVELDRIVRERVIDLVDHQHLNLAVPEFGEGKEIPTSENLVRWIHRQLAQQIPLPAQLTWIRLEEDEDLAASWQKSSGRNSSDV